MRPPIEAVLVVVPARDEQMLLGACLDAVALAAEQVDMPVVTVVVLDRCTDGTETVLHGTGSGRRSGASAGPALPASETDWAV